MVATGDGGLSTRQPASHCDEFLGVDGYRPPGRTGLRLGPLSVPLHSYRCGWICVQCGTVPFQHRCFWGDNGINRTDDCHHLAPRRQLYADDTKSANPVGTVHVRDRDHDQWDRQFRSLRGPGRWFPARESFRRPRADERIRAQARLLARLACWAYLRRQLRFDAAPILPNQLSFAAACFHGCEELLSRRAITTL